MNARRIVVSLLAVACVAVVNLNAGNVQSSFVPGDFGPVAGELRVPQQSGYYDLALVLGAIVERLPKAEDAALLTDLQASLAAAEATIADEQRVIAQLTARIATLEVSRSALENRQSQLESLQAQETSTVGELQRQVAAISSTASGIKIGFVNVDAAFQVFLNAVSDLRLRSTEKVQQISDLQVQYKSGAMSQEQYQRLSNQYNTELLDANVALYASVLDRMIASPYFGDLKADLQTVRTAIQSLVDESKSLALTANSGAVATQEFQLRLSQAQVYYAQIEKVVNQACAVKISQAAQRVAINQSFDLVLIQKNVLLYFRPATVTDITDLVKLGIANYL